MIELRRRQLNLAEGLIAEEVEQLWESWMRHVDEVLADEVLLTTVYEALAARSPQSRTRGRRGTPAEVVLRLLLLKHIRGWSYEVLEREVRANLVYRQFTRVGAGKVPDAKTLGRIARALGPEVGVARVSIPNYATKSKERKKLQKSRWFRDAQKWRTGSEGRISVVKRRHGLNRCRYKGLSGIKRWVGLGVIGDNLINIGQALAESSDT